MNKIFDPKSPKGLLATLAILILLGIAAGCVEIIDFNVTRDGNRLVVDGMITDKAGPYELRLRLTSQEEKITNPLEGASVTLYDSDGKSDRYIDGGNGRYLLPDDIIKGEAGQSYYIKIMLPDGREYQSRPEIMPSAIAVDSIYYQFADNNDENTETKLLNVFANTSIPTSGDPLYLKWELEETFKFTEYDFPDPLNHPPPVCYVTDRPDPQQILLYDGTDFDTKDIMGQQVAARELDYTFFQRHYLNLVQFSITKNAFDYWSQIDEVINSSGTIFDVPPSTAEGNIYNVNNPEERALGYFQAARVDTSRFFLTHADIPFYIPNPCSSYLRNECTNCSAFENSSGEPPFFWLDD